MSRKTSLKPLILSALGSAAACLAWPAPPAALAGLSVVQLGQQAFPDGTSHIYAWQIRGAGADEPYPFDGTIFGDDRDESLGAVHYTYHFERIGLPDANSGLRAAWLTIGALDFDSPPGE